MIFVNNFLFQRAILKTFNTYVISTFLNGYTMV